MGVQGQEIASRAAGLIVEEGVSYGAAKKQAAAQLGYGGRIEWPDSAQLLQAVREHIALFCPSEQATALAALRSLALVWMDRLADFRPSIVGAVWNGTATHHSAIHLDLYCDDSKQLPIFLINKGQRYEESSTANAKGQEVPVYILDLDCPTLAQKIPLVLTVLDRDDQRHAARPVHPGSAADALRGSRNDLQRKMETGNA
jgi:hypothetical protein